MPRATWLCRASYHQPRRTDTSLALILSPCLLSVGQSLRLVASALPHYGDSHRRRRLHLRLVRYSQDAAPSSSRMAAGCLPSRPRNHLARHRLAARWFRRRTAQRSYGGASAPDVLRSAASAPRLSDGSAAPRSSPRSHRDLLAPLIRSKLLRKLGHFLTTPLVAWLAMNLIFLGWHVPAAYDFALEHEHWHDFEHICFLGSSILFWWPIIRPWPSARASCWAG